MTTHNNCPSNRIQSRSEKNRPWWRDDSTLQTKPRAHVINDDVILSDVWKTSCQDVSCFIHSRVERNILNLLSLVTWCKIVKIFTARVRSTREGNIYTWECLSVHHWGEGAPWTSSRWGGTPSQLRTGVSPSQIRKGYPPSWPGTLTGGTPIQTLNGGGYPLPEQHSVYLLRGGRYASCFHAGGLSCHYCFPVWSSKPGSAIV